MGPSNRLDDGESIFFNRELEQIKSRTYDVKYPMLKQRDVIPMSFEGDPADQSVTYYQYDTVGVAKIVRDYANDFQAIDVIGNSFNSPIRSLGAAFQYNIQEIRSARKTGKSLDTAKATAARRAIFQQERDLAYWGSSDDGIPGWFTNANISDVSLTTGDWQDAATTADNIVDDANELINSVIDTSKTVETPNTWLLPVAYYTLLASTPRSANSDTTILSFLMQNNPFLESVDWLAELASANSFGNFAKDHSIVYDRNPEKFWLEVPQEYEQFPPEQKGLSFKVNVHERCGGTIIPYPLSMAMTDDIDAP